MKISYLKQRDIDEGNPNGNFTMTFLEYLEKLSVKEYKALLVSTIRINGWLEINCGGEAADALLNEMLTRCLEGKRRDYPPGCITEQEAHDYIIYNVVKSHVGHEYKSTRKKHERFPSLEKMTSSSGGYSLLEQYTPKKSDLSEQLQEQQYWDEIPRRIENHSQRQPRIKQVFDLLLHGVPIDAIAFILGSNKTTIYEDISIIKVIIHNYFEE